jgi:cytochrome c553
MMRCFMRTAAAFGAIAVSLATSSLAYSAGSVEAGQAKSLTCAACHGPDGNSVNAEWPSLAGQNGLYTQRQLEAYRKDEKETGSRSNVLMSGMAKGLSDEDIADLAAYYAAQTPARLTADPTLVARGQKIYRGGDAEAGVSACIACHGPTGHGNPLAGYPRIAGQHATYIVTTLKEYAAGARQTDVHVNQMMRNVSAQIRQQEGDEKTDMDAVASYIQGLR